MSSSRWSEGELNGFHEAAQSLKLYRRAELQSETDGESLIETLYVDPLPNDHVLNTILRKNATFVIGRKGTGKSTIFQRAQHELRKIPGSTSAYIDIKTIYESSQVDPALITKLSQSTSALPAESIEQLLLYKAFLRSVIRAIRDELASRVKVNLWGKIKATFSGSADELFEGLDELLESADTAQFTSVTGLKSQAVTAQKQSAKELTQGASAQASLGAKPELRAGLEDKDTVRSSTSEQTEYSEILMRMFNIKEYILRLKALLNGISIKHLYIFVDDFSELPEEAMRIVVDTILAPLNNWSEELVKFKVAAYPSRLYYGSIDKTKIDEINLDLYNLYGTADVSDMEKKAVDFTRRLVERRLEHFCKTDASVFIEARSEEDVWRVLFYATMSNPRNLGYVLFYIYESNLIYGRVGTTGAIRDAARKYYEEKLEPYFVLNRFLHESFSERASIFSLKELLNAIVKRARELRSHQGSAVMRDLRGRPPTSHFHVVTDLEGLLSTLELNFFLTKYYDMSDRDGRKVSVYALNYGLCQKYTIEFGRPIEKREHRLYFVERIFDYTAILQAFMKTNQEIVCENCGHTTDIENLSALAFYGMMCPECRSGTCRVVNLSKKYEEVLRQVNPELLLPRTELGILQTLEVESRPLFASDIAGELDCSYQLVGKRGKFLAERGLVDRNEDLQGRRQFSITESAHETYFRDTEPALDLEES
jgi:DNA-binding MarR family transcriptional regulator